MTTIPQTIKYSPGTSYEQTLPLNLKNISWINHVTCSSHIIDRHYKLFRHVTWQSQLHFNLGEIIKILIWGKLLKFYFNLGKEFKDIPLISWATANPPCHHHDHRKWLHMSTWGNKKISNIVIVNFGKILFLVFIFYFYLRYPIKKWATAISTSLSPRSFLLNTFKGDCIGETMVKVIKLTYPDLDDK